MRLALLAIAIISLAAGGCTSRTDPAAIEQRVRDQVRAASGWPDTDLPTEATDTALQVQSAKRELWALSFADQSDPAVIAAQATTAAKIGALLGYRDAMRGAPR